MTSEERADQLTEAISHGEVAVSHAQASLADKPGRREVTKIAIAVAIVVSLLMCAVAIAVSTLALSSSAATAAAQQSAQKDTAANQKLAQEAYESAQEANRTLSARGQQTVPLPEPGAGDATDSLVAAATARVLASLPPGAPTAAALGQAIAGYFIVNPITPAGPTVSQLAASVAAYLDVNPAQRGEDGEPGKDGKDAPPATEQAITSAFLTYVQANPEFLPQQLCRNYGQNFNQAKDLTSSDGTRYTLYGCITEVQPPIVATTPAPTPEAN